MVSANQQMAAELIEAALAKVSKQETEYVTIKEACEIAKVSRWTIRRWTKLPDNGIIVVKLGTAKSSPVRIEKDSFMAFLTSKTIKSNASKEAN